MNKHGAAHKIFGLLLLLTVACASPASAEHEKELEEINALLDDGKYESAAAYISEKADLMKEPRFVRLYSRILTNYYTHTINFHFFALKDLKKGERVADYRGKSGNYTMLGGDLEQLLYDRYNENPDSPDLNFAVGDYIATGETCGCGNPLLFVGDKGSDFPYLLKAYEGGVYDYFSLFRLGYHNQRKSPPDLEKAVFFYEKSFESNPDHPATAYNLGTVYFMQDKIDLARKYAEHALGKYGDSGLDADTYNLYGRIEYIAGNTDIAEKSLVKALELQSWHDYAFMALIDLYRNTGQGDKYAERVLEYIAADYSNTYLFNVYVDYLAESGYDEADEKIVATLAEMEFKEPLQTGAVNFNVGRVSEAMGKKELALKSYRKSLKAMESLDSPPEGATEALNQAIAKLSGE